MAAPILPHRISPRCSAAPKGSGGSPCAAALHRDGLAAGPDRAQCRPQGPVGPLRPEDRQHAVADELSTSPLGAPPRRCGRTSVEGCDRHAHRLDIAVKSQIAQSSAARMVFGAAAQRAGLHSGALAPAEIGRARQSAARAASAAGGAAAKQRSGAADRRRWG
jgi:hypothetical protein